MNEPPKIMQEYYDNIVSKNNKGRRQELTRLKYLKRCKVLGLDPNKYYCYKAQGKPCSCFMCSCEKFSRKVKHKNICSEFVDIVNDNFWDLI